MDPRAGLGDVAVPGLLAGLALRYDASRATDMHGRARAAGAAFMESLNTLEVRFRAREKYHMRYKCRQLVRKQMRMFWECK